MRGQKKHDPPDEDENGRFICTAEELAAVLWVSRRQVSNYVQMGMPQRNDKRYYVPTCARWHEQHINFGHTRYWDDQDEDEETQ